MVTKREKPATRTLQPLPDLLQLPDAQIDALAVAADQVAIERDQAERDIKSLLESGKDDEALALMRKHLNVTARQDS